MMGFKDIGPDEFKKGLEKNPNAELIDVRTSEEYNDAHLKGAKLMNIMSPDFVQKVEQLPKDKAYYIYCRSGSRSASACQYMAGRGFSQLYNLQGGIMYWPYEIES